MSCTCGHEKMYHWKPENCCSIDECTCTGYQECEHKWGTDGVHSNVFCKKCFITKPYTHEEAIHELAKKMRPHLHIK